MFKRIAILITIILLQRGTAMATLLFDEQFNDTNLSSRGWSTDGRTASLPNWGYFYENDTTLNKQVIYGRWRNGQNNGPRADNGQEAWTIWHRVTTQQMSTGVTIYSAVRFHNWMRNGNGQYSWSSTNSHTMLRASISGSAGSVPGEVMLESDRYRSSDPRWSYPETGHNLPDGAFHVSIQYNGQPDRHWSNWQTGDYIDDDIWYEVALYLNPNGGNGATGRIALWYRVYGTTDWTNIFDHTGVIYDGVVGSNPGGPFVGWGPYFHHNHNNQEVRAYLGWLTVYDGDAMADGDIGEGGGGDPDNGNGGGNGGETGPLTISNHNVKTTDTTASLTWDTNKPSNSVVDVGVTEERGMIFRGNTGTNKHVVDIDGLIANTTYYYRYSSRTADGETVMDQENSTFTTKETGGGDNGGDTGPVEVSLNDLTDVTLDSPIEGQILMYRGGQWINLDAQPLVAQLVEEILGKTSLVVKS